MRTRWIVAAFVAGCFSLFSIASGQGPKDERSTYPKSGFRAEYLKQLDEVEKKLVSLGETFPDSKYSWRPMKGVRSVSEVFVHVASSNYLLPEFAGIKPPTTLAPDLEKTLTRKARVLDFLKQSFAFMRQAMLGVPDADLDKSARLFGEETTIRGIFFYAGLHMHEHLGQMIAYTRTNHLVPPWSATTEQSSR